MSDFQKASLFVVLVGLSIAGGKASAKLAREIGVPALALSIGAGLLGHILSPFQP